MVAATTPLATVFVIEYVVVPSVVVEVTANVIEPAACASNVVEPTVIVSVTFSSSPATPSGTVKVVPLTLGEVFASVTSETTTGEISSATVPAFPEIELT